MKRDTGFRAYCSWLDTIRGQIPTYKPTVEWEQRIFKAVNLIQSKRAPGRAPEPWVVLDFDDHNSRH